MYNNIQNDLLHQNIILEDLKVYNNIQNEKTRLSYTQITPKHNTGRSKGVQQRYITKNDLITPKYNTGRSKGVSITPKHNTGRSKGVQ